ncbi:MAG: D-xylose ABC transporter substrate-binding protein [Microbacteriaceae bacterium]|nr:MAG: D-xylose ABC transporter substrate-binding protein [Microbacteriaceae bacterium]
MLEQSFSQTATDTGMSRRNVIKAGLIGGLTMAGLPLLLSACATDDKGKGGAGDAAKGAVIGFSLGTLAQRRWQLDREYIEAAAKEQGMKVVVQAANDDTRLQASQVENLLAQNIDVLILSPIDVKASAPSVAAAKAAGVPVISYNSVIQDADIDFWIARDNIAVGALQAEMAVKDVPKGNYVIVSGEGGVDIAQQKTQGNLDVLKPYVDSGDITVVSQRYHQAWDPAKGLAQIEDALATTGNKIDALLCNYDGFIVSALPALASAGLLGKTWIGGEDVFKEVAQAIVKGDVAMSAFTPIKTMAGKAVDAAAALASKKKPTSDASLDNGFKKVPGAQIKAIAVRKDGMKSFLEETSWLAPDDVFVTS